MALTGQFEVPGNSDTGIEFTNTQSAEIVYTFSASGTWTSDVNNPSLLGCTAEGFPSLHPMIQDGIKKGWPDFEKYMKYPNNTPYGLVAQNVTTGAASNVGKKATIVLKPGETLRFVLNDYVWDYGNNSGTIAVTWSGVSLVSKVMKFDGDGDYVVIPPDSLPTGNEITVSFWAKGGNALPKRTCLIAACAALNERVFNVHLPWSDGIIYFDCGLVGTSFDRIEKQAQPTDYKNQWFHWAFTKNAQTGEMKIYRNGELWHSGGGKTRVLPKASQVVIGVSYNDTASYYDGCVAELSIWNKARSQGEIQADMSKRLTGKEANLVSYWPLNEVRAEGSALKVSDLTNNLSGTVTGAVLVEDSTFLIH